MGLGTPVHSSQQDLRSCENRMPPPSDGRRRAVRGAAGSGCKYRQSFTRSPASHLLLCRLAPNRPWTVAQRLGTPGLKTEIHFLTVLESKIQVLAGLGFGDTPLPEPLWLPAQVVHPLTMQGERAKGNMAWSLVSLLTRMPVPPDWAPLHYPMYP